MEVHPMAIIGLHALIYSRTHEETRAFFREALGLPAVDAGEGWPIFAAPPTEIAVHPSDGDRYHELWLMCDDIGRTLAELTARGVTAGPIGERPWGRTVELSLPGGECLHMYEPRHPTAIRGPR